ncbi:MAG: hypothetical protein ABI665_03325 [Vicinamibacterales bacterium]
MIDGMKLDVSADEIATVLEMRMAEHLARAEADEVNAKQLEGLDRAEDDGDDGTGLYGGSPATRLRRRAQRARERRDALTFMRNHLVRGETYRLTTSDLEVIEVL